MTNLSSWKATCFLCVFCAVAAIGSQTQTSIPLYSFCSQTNCTDGEDPEYGPLVQGPDGNIYGTTYEGGVSAYGGGGTVFKITPTGTLTTLYNFCSLPYCADGSVTWAGLTLGTDGNFYGVTFQGGANNWGTVFKITPTGALTTLYSFCSQTGCTDGAAPQTALIQATDGNFYGTTGCTAIAGATGGTIFRVTSTGTLTTLYTFTGGPDGACPNGPLVQGTGGNLYGTTSSTFFRITLQGALTTLQSVGGSIGPLVQATDGYFYGTTTGNSVFKVSADGSTLTTLYRFCSQPNCTDGSVPSAGLVQATDGNFYGATEEGGGSSACSTFGCGTIFKLSPEPSGGCPIGSNTGNGWCETVMHSFDLTDGSFPAATLLRATNGNLYGTTIEGGANANGTPGYGTVFSLTAPTPLTPTITSTAPMSAIAGGAGFTLTVNGTNFVSGSTVNFNGKARTTTFVGATQLRAAILASDIATAGTFNVAVSNPSGGTSNAVSFTVVTPQQATQAIINAVNALFAQGVLNGGQDNSLVVKLQHAIDLMNAGKNAAAIGNLNAVISEVNDLLSSGVLSASEAASLVSAAESVITQLS